MRYDYDAIVIGSGIGGLTAAAVMARAGKRVLVLERNDSIGGAAAVYRHGGLDIEASLHEIDGLDPDDPKYPLMRDLGLDRDLRFVPVGDLYEVRGGPLEAPFVLPGGIEDARAAATAAFPLRAQALRHYFETLATLRHAASVAAAHMDDHGWWLRHLPEAMHSLWPVLKAGTASVSDVLEHLFGDDEAVKCALAANLPYYHDSPDTLPFLQFAVAQAGFLIGGGHYVHGGSRALAERLAGTVQQAGGAVRTGDVAEAILLDGNRAAGLRHRSRDGVTHVTFAAAILGNAAPEVLANMLPEAAANDFRRAYEGLHPSVSLWTMAFGLSAPARNFGVRCYSTVMLPDWMNTLADYGRAFAVMADPGGAALPPFIMADYGAIDSGLNLQPPYLCALAGLDRLVTWVGLTPSQDQARREAWMDRLVAVLDREFPGFAGAVVQREMATAATMHRYLNTPAGAVYGFAPRVFGGTPRTDVARLYLASAWTMGGGYTGAMIGGAAAARAALRDIAAGDV